MLNLPGYTIATRYQVGQLPDGNFAYEDKVGPCGIAGNIGKLAEDLVKYHKLNYSKGGKVRPLQFQNVNSEACIFPENSTEPSESAPSERVTLSLSP